MTVIAKKNLLFKKIATLRIADLADVGKGKTLKLRSSQETSTSKWVLKRPYTFKNIAKGTTDLRVKFISHNITQILIKFQFQNLD